MKQLRAALAGLLSLFAVASAMAQSAPANMGYHTLYGRLGAAPGDTGPGQAIPFSSLYPLIATIPLPGSQGGTNNTFMQFTGPATSIKTYTLPNANSTLAALGQIQTWTGAQSFSDGTLILLGSSSGSSTIKAPATGGGTAILFPGSDTIVGRASTDTLTNKTFVCANQTSCVVRLGSDVTGLLPLANIATGSQDTALGYWGSTAASATAIPNCANALAYSTSTHTFSCNATAGTGTLTGGTYPLSNSGANATYVGPTDSGRLTYTSTTALAFVPYNGDTIRIGGAIFQIPASTGIAGLGAPTSVFLNGVAAQTLAINTTYFVYAFSNAGTVTADFSTTSHVTSSTAGNIGTEIKSGDNTRTLIGMVRTGGTVIYASDLQTASWFNRRNKMTTQAQSLAAAGNTTAISFVTWSDESVAASNMGFMGGSAAAVTTIQNRVDGGASGPAHQGTTTAGSQITMSSAFEYSLSEGNHTFDGTLSATGGTANLSGTSFVRIRG